MIPEVRISGPGPRERRWTSRLHFKLFRVWPQSVVDERLARAHEAEIKMRQEMDSWFKQMYRND